VWEFTYSGAASARNSQTTEANIILPITRLHDKTSSPDNIANTQNALLKSFGNTPENNHLNSHL